MWRKWVGEKLIMNKIEKFKEELGLIKNEKIRKFAESAIEIMPDYFFVIPASSTGKYHPAYTTGKEGLLKHTRAAVRIAYELFRLDWWKFTDDEMDAILVSIMLHDGWKNGLPENNLKFTQTDHPLVASKMIDEKLGDNIFIDYPIVSFICSNIETHMGQWVKGELEKPQTKFQKCVHLADYLASRKCLIMDFNVKLSKE